MKTTIGVLLFAYYCVLICLSAGQPDINGSWTTYYGGNFYLCADDVTGEVNGVYSELGYVKGTLVGSSLSGYWFQTGLNVADLNGRCCTPNRGTFSFTFPSSTSFSGSYRFEDTRKGGESWSGTKRSIFNPTSDQCWSPKEMLTKSIEGGWYSESSYWDQCIDSNGVWTASYEYGFAPTRGYIFGQCFFNGQFCQGDWFEPNRVTGGYMVRLLANDEMVGTWWQFNASDIDSLTYTRYANNPSYHATEISYRAREAVSCNRNQDLFFRAGLSTPVNTNPYTYTPISSPVSTTRPELGFDAIIGIIFAAVGSTIVGMTVLVCLFCRPQCRGGRGGSAHRHHSTRTRRHGFGTTHRRFGGGYS